MNHETLHLRRLVLQLSFRMRPEYFSWMDAFSDLTAFIVLSEEPHVVQANIARTLNRSTIASTPNASTITKKPSRNLSRRALAYVKIVRGDLDNNRKPSNLRSHNHTVHVNMYREEQACVTYLLHKIREEMVKEDLVLVGSFGLVIYDQDGTRGKLFLFHFLLTSAGWGGRVGQGWG